MNFSDGFNQGMYDGDIDINITNTNQNVNDNTNMNYNNVPHVCPINTRIVNNHIYKHTYQPRYTCCEENTVTNEQCGSCCQFK